MQLFDIMNDPWETKNLASNSANAATISELYHPMAAKDFGQAGPASRIVWHQCLIASSHDSTRFNVLTFNVSIDQRWQGDC
jgi:hypothetical protein